MMRQEIPNNTPEQVREYLREALAVVTELEPPEDLREAVFTQAAQMVAGKQILMQQQAGIPDLGRNNSDLSRRLR